MYYVHVPEYIVPHTCTTYSRTCTCIVLCTYSYVLVVCNYMYILFRTTSRLHRVCVCICVCISLLDFQVPKATHRVAYGSLALALLKTLHRYCHKCTEVVGSQSHLFIFVWLPEMERDLAFRRHPSLVSESVCVCVRLCVSVCDVWCGYHHLTSQLTVVGLGLLLLYVSA